MNHPYRGQALITFSYDDGRRSAYEVGLPLHEKWGIMPSFAIIAGRVFDPKRWGRHLTPEEIVDAHRRGVEIASHGMLHKRRLPELDDAELEHELSESRRLLTGLLSPGTAIDAFCVPFSSHDDRVLAAAGRHYPFVRGAGSKLNDLPHESGMVKAFGLRDDTQFEELRALIDRAAGEHKWLVLMLHGVAADGASPGRYDIPADLLDRILGYVAQLGPERILPVRFGDVRQLGTSAAEDAGEEAAVPEEAGEPPAHVETTVLKETDGYMISYHRNTPESDVLVISFGGLPSRKTRTGFGSQFILKQGYDHIFVAQEAGTFYQKLSLEEFHAVVGPVVGNKRVFTYGSSLGGYAAMYYGGILNARMISCAPRLWAHPSLRTPKYAHLVHEHRELKDVPRSEHAPVVLYDPHIKPENVFIQACVLPAYPDAQLVAKPFAGHTVLTTMLHSGVLKDVINSYIRSGVFPDFRLKEEDGFIWQREKGRHALETGDAAAAVEHLEASLRLHYDFDAAKLLLRALVKARRWGRAREVLGEVARQEGGVGGLSGDLVARIEKQGGKAGKAAPGKAKAPTGRRAEREARRKSWLWRLLSWMFRRRG